MGAETRKPYCVKCLHPVTMHSKFRGCEVVRDWPSKSMTTCPCLRGVVTDLPAESELGTEADHSTAPDSPMDEFEAADDIYRRWE